MRAILQLFVAVLALVIAATAGLAVAGNGWNPPVREPDEERRLRRVGAEFFRLVGQIYLLLGPIEDRDLARARDTADSITRQVGVALSQCSGLRAYVNRNLATVRLAFEDFIRAAPENTRILAARGVLDPSDPVWMRVSKREVDFASLCERAVRSVEAASAPVIDRVKRGESPESLEVWRLLQAVETASKESRYFSIVLRP
jgi:hypothetical protein